jgi:hypothetical protein
MEAAIAFDNGDVVDAGLATAHEAVLVELPLFVAIRAVPLPSVKAHGDAIAVEGPEILDQAIVELFAPFAFQKSNNSGAALEDLGTVSPTAVLGIGQRDALGIP